MKSRPRKTTTSLLAAGLCLYGCSSMQSRIVPTASDEERAAAIRTLAEAIKAAPDAEQSASADIDWTIATLPWDRFTLPVIAPSGRHAAVQLGPPPPRSTIFGDTPGTAPDTVIELHSLDPQAAQRTTPRRAAEDGLLLSRFADDQSVLVEAPRGEAGRWIGRVEFATGAVEWIVEDSSINAFPALGPRGALAWSRRDRSDDRFHLVVRSGGRTRIIDDGTGDWLFPQFTAPGQLRAWRITDGGLHLVQLDLASRDPLLTQIDVLLVPTGATRALAWQLATTNPAPPVSTADVAFHHPLQRRMAIWSPGASTNMAFLAPGSIAAAAVGDGTWLVATDRRLLRQRRDQGGGIHLRDSMAIPVATTSPQWTHLLLVPDGNRLLVRAINVGD